MPTPAVRGTVGAPASSLPSSRRLLGAQVSQFAVFLFVCVCVCVCEERRVKT